MKDSEILNRIKRYFDIRELVGKETFLKHGQRSWKFFDFRLLQALLIIRENLGREIYVNNWDSGGTFDERGLRSNVQEILKGKTMKGLLYLSGHVLGKAVDFDVKGMTAEEVRTWIVENADLFPFKIRLEKDVSWIHLDVIYEEQNSHIYFFEP